MSTLSGDEAEVVQEEPVRRTRSGRPARKVAAAATPVKKTPAKKVATRAKNSPKKTQEVEEVEEENSAVEDDSQETPANGVQATEQQNEKELPEESENMKSELTVETNLEESPEAVPELESPPPPVVTSVQTGTPIHSTLKVKESSQLMKPALIGTSRRSSFPMQDESQQVSTENNKVPEVDISIEENTKAPEEAIPVEVEKVTVQEAESTLMEVDEEVAKKEENEVNELSDSGKDSPKKENDVEKSEAVIVETEAVKEVKEVEEVKEEEEEKKLAEVKESENSKDVEMISAPAEAEPDTEAVSEDELPTEATAKEPETEAVSDEELPAAPPADLGETESVSEDELPPDSEKKKKGSKKSPEKKPKVDGTNKRKLNAEGEYDPSSPTSENNDETPAKKVALTSETDADVKAEVKPASPKKKSLPELDKYWKAVNEDPSDFTGWTYLLQYVDQENDAEAAREAYSKFLERYPYCYGYWRKYADYEKKKGDPENVQKVFDAGLKAISLSVDLWLHYINHCKVVYEKDEKKMREQYERAIAACGLEFRSDRLWESYIKWETEGKRLNKVTAIYDRLLCTPTLGYISHFEAFQEFVSANAPNQILSVDDFLTLRSEVKTLLKSEDVTPASSADAPPGEEPPPHEVPPTDEETRAIREKIISSRRKMHKANVNSVAARWSFEEGIKRPYFHVKPLERCQLKNWKEYLDYEINEKDLSRIIILFERCLIACALYDEFWMRFVRFLESSKGDNSEKIRDVYTRACTVHHPKKPNLHLQWATFEENQGNFEKAAEILENIDAVLPNMLQIAYRRINLERRRGDLDKACTLYESYIANSKNRTIANNIAVKYARFLCKVKNDTDKAVKTLLKAADKDKDNPRLYLQLIDLGLQRNPVDTQEIVGYMDMFIDREHADLEQRVLFAQRKVEFLEDFSPDIRQVLKAHEQFQKCIKQAKERKKVKNDDSKVDLSPPKKMKSGDQSSVPPPPSISSQSSYQYSSGPSGPYQSQQQFQGSQYGSQSGYQQGYQQYPPPSDPNYANYQNWQYGQSGPQTYGPYNQWGSYNYY
ncbi:pre-mRNA-processing factor 39-like isoform X2 [Belonocnema kinseyi]|uniref:pre-mRNA-processing factor 39-like isoform X2 n=1 Tax=Belonocnema kinseyi TaxID=2817044 RepID=UPI00143DBE91|nr:pre-mRNA-processing factor 39-like isoform X2 [Belonocnema kinseyi]